MGRLRHGRRPARAGSLGQLHALDDTADHEVKRVVVEPGHRLSHQRHQRRHEHWSLVGDYFGEDDIERLDDDDGRTGTT